MFWKFLRDLFTEDDRNQVFCLVRILSGAGGLTLISGLIGNIVHTGSVDIQAAGIGFGGFITAVGSAIGIKSRLGGDTAEVKQ